MEKRKGEGEQTHSTDFLFGVCFVFFFFLSQNQILKVWLLSLQKFLS